MNVSAPARHTPPGNTPEEKVAFANLTEMDKELPYQLIGVGCDFHQHPIDRPFGYPAYQWLQTCRGRGLLQAEGREQAVPPDCGMLLYPGTPHAYHETDEGWQVHWITFGGYHIEGMLHKLGLDRVGVYRVSEALILESRMRRAYQLISRGTALSGMEGSVLIYQLLLDLYRALQTGGDQSRGERAGRLTPVFSHINQNLDSVISVDSLADIIGITPQHFCVLFKEVTGRRPVDYINAQRVKAAKDLLALEPSLQVGEVGRRVGFDNNSYFSTIFRRYEGISPRQYKELH